MMRFILFIISFIAVWMKALRANGARTLAAENMALRQQLFQFHRWKANLRILEIKEIKSVPYVPISHPFVERLIGTLRREFLDRLFFWNTQDLQNKLDLFQAYYNECRGHCGIEGNTPQQKAGKKCSNTISLDHYRWKKYCHGLFQLPMAA